MSRQTKIQWCDSTVNPIMGCAGCELFPAPRAILRAVDEALMRELGRDRWRPGGARVMFTELIQQAWAAIEHPGRGHSRRLTTTNIYHFRRPFEARLRTSDGSRAASAGLDAIEQHVKCYAAKLHANKAFSIANPSRHPNRGYAPSFEQVTPFPGRLQAAAAWPDLRGLPRAGQPWLDTLPRLIFVSDMGDALSRRQDFEFLRRELEATQTPQGRRHLWLWLTKRPQQMADIAASLGGLPANICAMTTVTSAEVVSRVAALRRVDARIRGLSIEPLSTPIAAALDLKGIDWVIVGGESGARRHVKPFDLAWGEALMELCRDQGVAFFWKQYGRLPLRKGVELALVDKHGGDWSEWDPHHRVHEFPGHFHEYRSEAD